MGKTKTTRNEYTAQGWDGKRWRNVNGHRYAAAVHAADAMKEYQEYAARLPRVFPPFERYAVMHRTVTTTIDATPWEEVQP